MDLDLGALGRKLGANGTATRHAENRMRNSQGDDRRWIDGSMALDTTFANPCKANSRGQR